MRLGPRGKQVYHGPLRFFPLPPSCALIDRTSFSAMGGAFLSEATGEFVAMWASYSYGTTKGNQEVCSAVCTRKGAGL